MGTMDGTCPSGIGYVFRLHLHGCTLTAARVSAVGKRLGTDGLRSLRRIRNISERIRILPDFRRHHPRQDGCTLHRHPLGLGDADRRCDQFLRPDRCVCQQCAFACHGRLCQSSRHMVEHHSVLQGHAGVSQIIGHRIHDIRMRCRNGRHHGVARNRKMVRR